ncbi:uncharacterized protein [Miscanthus floridulus]|uniref:uncharacterized protein n=1 Tax=Miscanthus floridulus TaxID=154761 RepID=UPI00345B4343
MKIDSYTTSFGAKGELQQAWFRVWDIPADQRSFRTCVKVGGLVGKVLEIDERTKLRHDYVRMKIACRGITKVPKIAESTLGLFLPDFTYERVVEVEGPIKTLQSGIKISEGEQPPPSKKYKADDNLSKDPQAKAAAQLGGKSANPGSDKSAGKKHSANVTMSAPPKIGNLSTAGGKLSVQKTYEDDGKGEKVHIPETFEDSDSDSDLGERIRKLEGFGDIGQGSSKQNDDKDTQHIWCMENNTPALDLMQITNDAKKLKNAEEKDVTTMKQLVSVEINNQTELDFSDEAIMHTQESLVAEDEMVVQEELPEPQDAVTNGGATAGNTLKIQEIRRSERLKKDIAITIQEKNERMARKRNLEGLYAEVDRRMLINGVNTMLKVSSNILLPQNQAEDQYKRLKQDDRPDDDNQN